VVVGKLRFANSPTSTALQSQASASRTILPRNAYPWTER
jgi:hypothetical protein